MGMIPAQDLQLDPRRHVLVDTDIARTLNDELDTDQFLTYWHVEHQHFVVARWANENQGLVTEYPLTFVTPLDVSRDDIDSVLYFYSPLYDEDLKREAQKTRGLMRDEVNAHIDRQRHLADRRKYVNRKTRERYSPAQLLGICW